MIDFETLCQKASRLQQTQRDDKAILFAEIEQLREQLAQALGLSDWQYQPVCGGESKHYVEVSDIQTHHHEFESPELSFKLSVVLDNDPTLYPKQPYALLLKVWFIQSDRLCYQFLHDHHRKVAVNLGDSVECKYSRVVETYTQLLSHKLEGRIR